MNRRRAEAAENRNYRRLTTTEIFRSEIINQMEDTRHERSHKRSGVRKCRCNRAYQLRACQGYREYSKPEHRREASQTHRLALPDARQQQNDGEYQDHR